MSSRQRKIIDSTLVLLVGSFCAVFFWRLFFSLHYQWNWQIVGSYILQPSETGQGVEPGLLLEGLFITVRISVYAMIIALFTGFPIALFRTSRRVFLRITGRVYVEMVRNLPALVLVFIFYYFISDQVLAPLGLEEKVRGYDGQSRRLLSIFFTRPELLVQFLSGVFTLGLFQGAYVAEIIRGGIESVPTRQWEAGAALGLPRWQQLYRIILPQAMRIMLPQLANEFINTIKWSSIVSIISIQELTYNGMQAIASTGATMEVWLVVAASYLLLCLLLSAWVRRLELRFCYNNEK